MSFNFVKGVLQLVCLQFFLIATPATAASQLFVNLGPAEFTLEVEDLKTFSATGEAPPLLKRLLNRLSPEEAQTMRALFSTQIKIDPTRLSKFLYTPQGEAMLRELGQVLQSESGLSGFYGLRAALVQAAQDEAKTGLTVPDVLEKFPSDRIRINQERIFELANAWTQFNQASQIAIARAAQPAAPDFKRFPLTQQQKLLEHGKFGWERAAALKTETGQLADVYVPTRIRRAEKPFEVGMRPVVVISHGLGGDRTSFVYLAKHYASQGFVVVVPEHPLTATRTSGRTRGGQSVIQADRFFEEEWAKEVVAEDFAQRPESISQLLNALALRSQTDPLLNGRVDINNVGVIGQSFGGYAALALGGAQINPESLRQHCPANAAALNLSLVLQCRARGLAPHQHRFRDVRVKAIAALNPVGSAVFGPEGMAAVEVPVLMLSGSHDVVTPALPEQFNPFHWLKTQHRYLMLLEGGTHLSLIENLDEISLLPQSEAARLESGEELGKGRGQGLSKSLAKAQDAWVVGPSPEQAKRYLKATSLAFFQTHLMQEAGYEEFLTPTFAATLSEGKDIGFSLLNQDFLAPR